MTTNLRQLMREMSEGYKFKKRMSNELFRDTEKELSEVLDALTEYSEETPCAVCGDVGYTLPCIQCDEPICVDHSYGAGFCKKCNLTREAINHPVTTPRDKSRGFVG